MSTESPAETDRTPHGEQPPTPADATYTPGMIGQKLLAIGVGLVILLVGIAWLARPTMLLLTGQTAEATVVAVVVEKPGQTPVELTTRNEVDGAEDQTRNATYTYRIRYAGPEGEPVEAIYDIGHVVRPQRSIGDELTVRVDPGDPSNVTGPYDIASWTFGGFFAVIGLVIVVTQAVVLVHARRPIEIDALDTHPSATVAEKADEDEPSASAT
jgi:hypothetical protein